ncbi:hypothetical protein VPH5P1C_0242 [Vibrio phage 5P1c]
MSKNKFSFKPSNSRKVWESWTTGDGTVITVDKMTESHAKNVLNLVLQRNRRIRDKLQLLGEINADFNKFLKEDYFPEDM